MISESIQQFRANRRQKDRLGTRAKTKARLGLASRRADQTKYEIRAAERAAKGPEETSYDPADKINSWFEEVESIRSERGYGGAADRADTEQSTTGALEEEARPQSRWDGPTGMSGGAGGRAGAEEYLGREISDEEWEMLARTTYAEATGDPEEQAAVMSVILNRVKADGYPDDIVGVVTAPNQFQAVTGTAKNPRPSSRFQAFNDEVLETFEAEVTPRLSNFADQNWLNFTAGNLDAYGEGTNPGFLDDVNKSEGSARIGGTVFGTVRG